ncbi:ubiquinone anaerobic biosynthesis accessory factor UbiT [Thaumasiovibrio sp. DFM-14]|uniref:ubiquinone anaerobic biosynthesis accessory factor UbiT n=1 Tax=Thaumasiovibrio sp. DFM-14 TaxID=3384792 RepID=UPI0039A30368
MIRQLHHNLVTQGPSWLRFPAKLTPFSVKRALLLNTLKTVCREALDDGEFEFLRHRWLRISVTDLALEAFISFDDDSLVVAQACERVDASFSADANDLILIAARREDPDTLFFQRRLNIEGDTELGLEVKNLMDGIDWSALPAPLLGALSKFADFIEAGLSAGAEVQHVDQN